MKNIKWKILIATCVVCLLPIFVGLLLWNKLPDMMPIHFNLYNEPDNYASKGFVVFGMPALMVILQVICCMINDFNGNKHGERIKFERVTKWIIPIMSFVLQIITLAYGLGYKTDIRKAVAIIIGIIFIIIGNYLPKFDDIKNYNLDTEKAKRVNRFIGFETVIMGILILITVFLPPIATIIWLILLIPYAVIAAIYGIKVARQN